jgi:hypothetical protein
VSKYNEFFSDHLDKSIRNTLPDLHLKHHNKRNYARLYRPSYAFIFYCIAFRPAVARTKHPAEIEIELFFGYTIRERNLRLAAEAAPLIEKFKATVESLGYIYNYDDQGKNGKDGGPMSGVRVGARFHGAVAQRAQWPQYCSRSTAVLVLMDNIFGAWIDSTKE